MAKKIKMTRPELKRQRDMLSRFERYLPMLKLKQQQLQLTLRKISQQRGKVSDLAQAAREKFEPYRQVLADRAGVDIRKLASPARVKTGKANVAGVGIPVFESVEFPPVSYSLFATPAWVDRALADLREVNRQLAQLAVLDRQHALLARELTKIVQRVNLFEKIMIPSAREAIRVIRIALGDEMTAAVGRAKIAKGKLAGTAEEGAMPDEARATAAAGPDREDVSQA
jgi:V/A-type H+-transporting ATPase subunit D